MQTEAGAVSSTDNRENVPGDGAAPLGGADLSGIGASLVDQMSPAQEHAIDEAGAAAARETTATVDAEGRSFDPAIHETNADGSPRINSRGKLAKKRGRKGGASAPSGAQSSVGTKAGSTVQVGPTPEQVATMQARQSGNAAAHFLMTFGVIAGGDEWQPRLNRETGLDEKTMLENAFADYFQAKGYTDIPPGMALCVAIAGYALPRFAMPKTQTRVGKLKQWIAKKVADRKLKKHGLKAEKDESRMEA